MNIEKTTWGNPILNVHFFAPQEYIVACSVITSSSSFLWWTWNTDYYIDLNKNSHYYTNNSSTDRGEHFDRNGVSERGASVDGVYRDVTAYSGYNNRNSYTGQIATFTKVTVKNGTAYNASQ